MDSLPYFDSLADRYEEQACPNSELINKRIAQKIEQGIGRGVRGEKDYCAILIIGSELVRFMRSIATNKFFSPPNEKNKLTLASKLLTWRKKIKLKAL